MALWFGTPMVMLTGCTGLINPSPRIIGSVTIGADLPLSGDDAPDGLPVRDAIELAIRQAGRVCGASSQSSACVTLHTAIQDDVNKGIHDPATGADNVGRLAADAQVVAMVGPLYDSLAKSELPIANRAGLPMVSPANTDECLTQEPADGHCGGLAKRLRPAGTNNYFRVVTTQLEEAPAAADLAFKMLGKRRAFVANDQSTLGQSLATGFTGRFIHDGGTVLDATDLGGFDPASPAGLREVTTRAAHSGADVVYFAGVQVGAGAALRQAMTGPLATAPLLGSDRLASRQFANGAGLLARGSYYAVPGSDPAGLKSAAGFLRDYRKAYARDATALSLQSFDATTVIIRAISRAIDDAGGGVPGRKQVLTRLASTDQVSTSEGMISFDQRGDTTLKLVTIYEWMAPTDRAGRFIATLAA